MRTPPVFFIAFLLALTLPAHAQHDGAQERTWTGRVNFEWQNPFGGESPDSVDALTLDAGVFIERALIRVDSVTAGVDSVQLRLGPSQIVLATYVPEIEGDGAAGDVQFRTSNHPMRKTEPLRLIYYGAPDPSGQIRVIVVYRELF